MGRGARRGFEEEEGFFGDFVAEFGGVVAVVAAYAEDFGGSDGREELEFGERGGLEVDGGGGDGKAAEDAGGEVFLRSLHGERGPEDAVALFDEGIAREGGAVSRGQVFAVTHLSYGSLRVSCTGSLGGLSLPAASTAETR